MHNLIDDINAALARHGLRVIRTPEPVPKTVPNTSENRSTPHSDAGRNAFEPFPNTVPNDYPEHPEEWGNALTEQSPVDAKAADLARKRGRLAALLSRGKP